jgi:ABC-2 type transport system permease protein
MRGLTAVFYREYRIRITNFGWIFWDLFFPLGYLLVFSVGMTKAFGSPFPEMGNDYTAFFVAGVVAMGSFSVAMNTSWGIFLDRDNGMFYEMLTYPLNRAELLAGKITFNLVLAVMQATITLAAANLLLGVKLRVELFPVLFAAVVTGTACWFFFFAIFALRTRRMDVFNSLTSVFYFLFLFASSMFYPLDPLPVWFRGAALVNPITWQVDLLRFGSIGVDTGYLPQEAAALGVFTLLTFVAGIRELNRSE